MISVYTYAMFKKETRRYTPSGDSVGIFTRHKNILWNIGNNDHLLPSAEFSHLERVLKCGANVRTTNRPYLS